MPAPAGVGGRDADGRGDRTTHSVLGTMYETTAAPPVMHEQPSDGAECLIHFDADQRVVYAGDYCSNRRPGVETAALSALEAARTVVQWAAGRGQAAEAKEGRGGSV